MEKREGEYQDFPSKIFCLTVPKISVGETFRASLFSGTKKVYELEGGEGIKIFRPNIFVSQCRKLFHYFRVSKNFLFQRVMSRLSIFCRIFFVAQSRNNS